MMDLDAIRGFLTKYFYDESYSDGIKAIRRDLANSAHTREQWNQFIGIIDSRSLLSGQALELVNNGANQVLYENSDKEAYSWLDQMIHNVERTDGEIEAYKPSQDL